MRIARLVQCRSSDTDDPGSNPSAATSVLDCVLEQVTLQILLLCNQVYKWVPVRDVFQCTAAACGAMC